MDSTRYCGTCRAPVAQAPYCPQGHLTDSWAKCERCGSLISLGDIWNTHHRIVDDRMLCLGCAPDPAATPPPVGDVTVRRVAISGTAVAPSDTDPYRVPGSIDPRLPTDPRLPKAPWWWQPEEQPSPTTRAEAGPPEIPMATGSAASTRSPSSPTRRAGEFFVGERREETIRIGSLGEVGLEGRAALEGSYHGSFDAGPTGVDGRFDASARGGMTLEAHTDLAAGPARLTGAGEAFVGGEVVGSASGHLGPDGASAQAGTGVFVGERFGGSGALTAAGMAGSGGFELEAGLGAHADIDASASWDRVGFKVDLGASLGFGGGTELGLSVNPQEMWDTGVGGLKRVFGR